MKLISMTDFVVVQENYLDITNKRKLELVINYKNFIKQSYKLEMFVPCDEYGNVLEKPEQYEKWLKSDHYFNASESVTHKCRMYKKAKEKVLFKGFELVENLDFVWKFKHKGNFLNVLKEYLVIEWLVGDNVELTESAIKQIII